MSNKKIFDNLIEFLINNNYLCSFITVRTKIWYNQIYTGTESQNNILKEEYYKIKNKIENIPLISFLFICSEKGSKNKIHYHFIVAFKNILGFNKNFIYNLKNYLILELNEDDIRCDLLTDFLEYKNRFNYILKEDFYLKTIHIYNKDILNYTDYLKKEKKIVFDYNLKNEFNNIGSFPKINNYYDEYTLINLINFYFLYNNIFLYKNIFYKKIENTLISYAFYSTVDNLTNLLTNIFIELIEKFSIQLNNIDIYALKIQYFHKLEQLFKKTKQIFINELKLDFTIIEFTDGIYFLKKNIFINKNDLKDKQLNNTGTLKYYNKSYKNLKVPEYWKNLIEYTLGNDQNSCEFFSYYSTLFNKNDDLLGKQKNLYVTGDSSTGKTTLLTLLINNFFGKQNVGTIARSNSNFALENLLDKEVAVIDEAEHSFINTGDFLQINEKNNKPLINIKYKNPILLHDIAFLFISNNKPKFKDLKIEKAIENRLKFINFKKELCSNINDYKKLINHINKYEINIIIFCNKLFFKKYVYNLKETPKIKNSIKIKTLLLK